MEPRRGHSQTSIYINTSLLNMIKKTAEENGRSVSSEISFKMRKLYEKENQENKNT